MIESKWRKLYTHYLGVLFKVNARKISLKEFHSYKVFRGLFIDLLSSSEIYRKEEICYVLALGNFYMGDYRGCLSVLNPLLKVDPYNEQFLELKSKAESQITKGICRGLH